MRIKVINDLDEFPSHLLKIFIHHIIVTAVLYILIVLRSLLSTISY